ncbi:hypothetical protein BOTBODRAFT_168778 [Botryobasidium botryosum FD-172 SS1]|uniref:Uncharacterized protein n=1 Tax=Botryobasidium botryosum (strain FD-172 SS1) TaxID=930990 RepID=A0A067N3H6_BOTB1|nr:hypothetical protein BOTBODRAFT_168778 [Botryobasidium botryosum FD-172 SS1]
MPAIIKPSLLSLRSSSRPSSPSPQRADLSVTAMSGTGPAAPVASPIPRPLTQNPFRRRSPTPQPSALTPAPDKGDALASSGGGTYLDSFSLKMSEAVAKAVTNPVATAPGDKDITLKGKKPLPLGRGKALGDLIISELRTVSSNSSLQRALLRQLHRPFSVLLSNLSNHLLPLLPLLPSSSNPTPNPNTAVEAHAFALATFSAEVLHALDDPIFLASSESFTGSQRSAPDSFRIRDTREGLESIIRRVLTPVLSNVKNELGAMIEHNADGTVPIELQKLSHAMARVSPSVARCAAVPGPTASNALGSLIIGVVWKALLMLSERQKPVVDSVQTAGPLPAFGMLKKPRTVSISTPPMTPPASRFTALLPSLSRPPTPPAPAHPPSPAWSSPSTRPRHLSPVLTAVHIANLSTDAQTLFNALHGLPLPAVGTLAREAVEEAFGTFEAFITLVGYLDWWVSSRVSPIEGVKIKSNSDPSIFAATRGSRLNPMFMENLETMSDKIPTLLVLNVLLRFFPLALDAKAAAQSPKAPAYATGHSLLGLSSEEYRVSCLTGFGRAEECAGVVAKAILDALYSDRGDSVTSSDNKALLHAWLEGRLEETATSN